MLCFPFFNNYLIFFLLSLLASMRTQDRGYVAVRLKKSQPFRELSTWYKWPFWKKACTANFSHVRSEHFLSSAFLCFLLCLLIWSSKFSQTLEVKWEKAEMSLLFTSPKRVSEHGPEWLLNSFCYWRTNTQQLFCVFGCYYFLLPRLTAGFFPEHLLIISLLISPSVML